MALYLDTSYHKNSTTFFTLSTWSERIMGWCPAPTRVFYLPNHVTIFDYIWYASTGRISFLSESVYCAPCFMFPKKWVRTFKVCKRYLKRFKFRVYLTKSGAGIAQWYSAGLRAGWSVVRVPAKAGNFSLHHRVQTGSEAYPASYPMGTRGSFPGVKVAGAWS
jgi:hypothetical protein